MQARILFHTEISRNPPPHCFRNFSFEKAQVLLSSLLMTSLLCSGQVVFLNQTLSTSSFSLLFHSALKEFATHFLLEVQKLHNTNVALNSSWVGSSENASQYSLGFTGCFSTTCSPTRPFHLDTTIYFCTNGKIHWKINGVLFVYSYFLEEMALEENSEWIFTYESLQRACSSHC